MAKIIGITGPSGSGKSLLCKHLSDNQIPCIDADAVYHGMLTPPSRVLDAIVEVFGADLLAADGSLDRTVLSARVFSDPVQLALLNATVLPIVVDEISSIIESLTNEGASTIAVDAPTLIESGFHKSCDMIVAVIASADARIERIKARDAISEERAKARVLSQKSDDFYTSVADITIFNDGDKAEFEKTVKEIAKSISKL